MYQSGSDVRLSCSVARLETSLSMQVYLVAISSIPSFSFYRTQYIFLIFVTVVK